MTQRQRTRRLAQAFTRLERAASELRDAERDLDDAFFPWAAGRSISRSTAREHLASVGLLEYTKP